MDDKLKENETKQIREVRKKLKKIQDVIEIINEQVHSKVRGI